jgi:prepilin-type N-terminal cleavage/methylation domain-containing protein
MRANKKGFTLIELLIVVVIIGILATIVLPQFDKVREKAFNATVLSDIRSTINSVQLYANTNYSFPNDENDLFAEGLSLSADVSFMSFSVSNPGELSNASVHVHIEHAGSSNFYHFQYPDDQPPELRAK